MLQVTRVKSNPAPRPIRLFFPALTNSPLPAHSRTRVCKPLDFFHAQSRNIPLLFAISLRHRRLAHFSFSIPDRRRAVEDGCLSSVLRRQRGLMRNSYSRVHKHARARSCVRFFKHTHTYARGAHTRTYCRNDQRALACAPSPVPDPG